MSEAKKINKKITGYKVYDKEQEARRAEDERAANVVQMNEKIKRPEYLTGSTYKISTNEGSMYVTINDIVLNKGTKDETRRPFEIFLNTKNPKHQQWTTALTLVISSVFRKGGDVAYLADDLKKVHDPEGGYFEKGGRFNSIIHHIGKVIEDHLISIGVIEPKEIDPAIKAMIDEKLAAQKERESASENKPEKASKGTGALCGACGEYEVIKLDGCPTCMSCGDSKCG